MTGKSYDKWEYVRGGTAGDPATLEFSLVGDPTQKVQRIINKA